MSDCQACRYPVHIPPEQADTVFAIHTCREEREHITDGGECWCNPRVVIVSADGTETEK